jgi:adenylate kinase
VVLERLVNRRVCCNCGRIYSTTARPATDWLCDNDGGDVVQRDDDKADAINHRLDVYDRQTAPLIPWYRERDLLVPVDGTGATAEVSARLVDAVDGRLSRVR